MAAEQAAAEQAAQKQAAALKAAEEKAALEAAAAEQAAQDRAAANAAADQQAADQAAADKAAADKAAAEAAAAQTTVEPPPAPAVKPAGKPKRPKLAQECLDAGLTAPQDCDAFLAAAAAQKAQPAPAVETAVPLPAEPAPAAPEPPKAAQAQPAPPDIAGGLIAAAESHNRGVARLAKAGADEAAAEKARAEIAKAKAEIDALCKSNGFDAPAQCLAQYAVELSPIPAAAGVAEAPAAPPVQPVEVIAALPKGVTKEDIAPLLDSAKDQESGKGPKRRTATAAPAPAEIAAAAAPPPKDDKSAQAGLRPEKVVPIDRQKGQKLDAATVAEVRVPRNVTIVNKVEARASAQPAPAVAKPGRPAPLGRRGDPPDNPIGLGLGIVLQFGNQLIVNSPAEDHRRIAYRTEDRTNYERLPGDRHRETVLRPGGVRIVTVYNRNGDVLRRSRFGRDGREIVLAYFDDRHEQDLLEWRDPGADLPPLRLRIPARDYVLDAERADKVRVRKFFAQPPVERVSRLYSIAEVKRSSRVRDMVRRLEIGNLTFNTGSASISPEQAGGLSNVAGAMLLIMDKNPAETFLIEGHTDAVGSDVRNLQLSDERAATIARVLTEFYNVPPENLATQGYGERYLKVQTELPERLNRRVTIRRITSLVTLSRN